MTSKSVFEKFLSDESGATAIEYGLIAALIGVGIIGGAVKFSGSLNGMFTSVDSDLVEAFGSDGPIQ
jgi:pilus assembly protein Flp/PilA